MRGRLFALGIVLAFLASGLAMQVQAQTFVFERLWPQLSQPWYFQTQLGLAVDASGNVISADTANNRIQVFTSGGTFVRKWGSAGTGDGQFNYPAGVAVDGSGNIVVADFSNNRIQVFTSGGIFLRKWGSSGTGDGQFSDPMGVAVDGSGNIFVADMGNHRVQVFDSSGAFLRKWGVYGAAVGDLDNPSGIAVDASGNILVSDKGNQRVNVFDPNGSLLRWWGSQGSADGQFSGPYGIGLDASGNVYVVDQGNARIQEFDSNGSFLRKWGSSGTGDGQFNSAYALAVGASGNIIVADTGRIQLFSATGTFLQKWDSFGNGDGQFSQPIGEAVDAAGNLIVCDKFNNRIQMFTSTGAFVRKWGSYGTADGQFLGPAAAAMDATGNIYVVDRGSNRVQVFSSTGVYLRKFGSSGSGDGQFQGPSGIAVDSSGNIIVVDEGNNRIQVLTSTGVFVSKWGAYGTGDGQFNLPDGVAVDSSGNIYVVERGNSRVQVFDSTGNYVRKWGSLGSGNGQFNQPFGGIAVDGSGFVYVADTYNSRIQVFSSLGSFLSKLGSLGSNPGEFSYPEGVAVDLSGNLFVADTGNNRIQKFSPRAQAPLNAPTLSSPSDGALNQAVNVNLQWADTNTTPAENGYRIRIKPSGGSYTYYTTDPNLTSIPTVLSNNQTYYWNVQAIGNGSGTIDSAWANSSTDRSFTTVAPLPTITGLTPNVTFPVAVGTSVQWTATATGGLAPLQYKFYVYTESAWTMVQDYSTTATCNWTPLQAGRYNFAVWVRNSGSAASYDAYRFYGYFDINPSLSVTLSPSPSLPRPAGTAITWTATATGGIAPLQYRFYVYFGSSWTMVRDYSTSNTCSWTPTQEGQYNFAVWVRNAGSVASYDAYTFYGYFSISPSLSVTLSPNPAFPQPPGTEITWTANATGGIAPLQYRFYAFYGGSWTMVQDYSTTATCSWTPALAGAYNFAVWVRNAGSVAPYDTYHFYGSFEITPRPSVVLSPNPAPPQAAGTPITWTATATGGIAPLQYKFYVYFGGVWTMVQDYSASATCLWTPAVAGQYNFAVWVRNSGSVADYDAYRFYGNFNITPGP